MQQEETQDLTYIIARYQSWRTQIDNICEQLVEYIHDNYSHVVNFEVIPSKYAGRNVDRLTDCVLPLCVLPVKQRAATSADNYLLCNPRIIQFTAGHFVTFKYKYNATKTCIERFAHRLDNSTDVNILKQHIDASISSYYAITAQKQNAEIDQLLQASAEC